jgi:recombination protein RecT
MEKYKGEIAKALPKHLTPDRMLRIAFTCLRINPKLQECDPLSFMGAIVQASSLGLEPGAQGHAYLVPFRNNKKGITECQFIPGYRGLIDLARRSGQIETIASHVVYSNDLFEYEYGFDEKLTHKPALGDRGEFVAVYAFCKLKGGGRQFEIMSLDQINKIKSRARFANPIWESDFDEMARKTVIRRIYKYLPTSIEMRETMNHEELNDQGLSQSNRTVIDQTYTPDLESNPTTIAELEKAKDDELETEEKTKAMIALDNRVFSLLEKGKTSEDIDRLIGDRAQLLSKDSKTIYAALEVLAEIKA